MKYASAAAFRQALEQRLKNEATNTGLGLARLRKRVAFELFLRRLLAVAPDRWVLKGALALDFRLAYTRRYGASGQPSTRPKDLVDILLIESSTTIDAGPLRHALESTFAERARQPLPTSLPPPRPPGQTPTNAWPTPSTSRATSPPPSPVPPPSSIPYSPGAAVDNGTPSAGNGLRRPGNGAHLHWSVNAPGKALPLRR